MKSSKLPPTLLSTLCLAKADISTSFGYSVFYDCYSFNSDLSKWEVSELTNSDYSESCHLPEQVVGPPPDNFLSVLAFRSVQFRFVELGCLQGDINENQ